MPDSYFHRRVATGVIKRLGPAAQAAVAEPRHCYVVGALGPDPLFAWRFWRPFADNPVRDLAGRLHTHATGAFLREYLQTAKAGGPCARAFALGFLCHYAADSSVHPYVYALTGEPADGAHFRLERGFDAILYHRDHPEARTSVPPPCRELAGLTPAERLAIGRSITLAAAKSHCLPVSPEKISQTLVHMAVLDWLLYSPHGGKRAVGGLMERIAHQKGMLSGHFAPVKPPTEDILNHQHRPWHTPWKPERIHTESVPELYVRAEERSIACIDAAAKFWSGELTLDEAMAVIGNRSMHSDLEPEALPPDPNPST